LINLKKAVFGLNYFSDISPIAALINLEDLDISFLEQLVDDEQLQFLKPLANLEKLDIDYSGLVGSTTFC